MLSTSFVLRVKQLGCVQYVAVVQVQDTFILVILHSCDFIMPFGVGKFCMGIIMFVIVWHKKLFYTAYCWAAIVLWKITSHGVKMRIVSDLEVT